MSGECLQDHWSSGFTAMSVWLKLILCLYQAQMSGECLLDHWSSGFPLVL